MPPSNPTFVSVSFHIHHDGKASLQLNIGSHLSHPPVTFGMAGLLWCKRILLDSYAIIWDLLDTWWVTAHHLSGLLPSCSGSQPQSISTLWNHYTRLNYICHTPVVALMDKLWPAETSWCLYIVLYRPQLVFPCVILDMLVGDGPRMSHMSEYRWEGEDCLTMCFLFRSSPRTMAYDHYFQVLHLFFLSLHR